MAIIVSDMCKSFHGVRALDSASFMIADGEFFSLLGPKNSGKSTVISCLSTLTDPDSGMAEINGRTLGVADESIAADVGVIFESIFLDLNLTVRGNISFHAALHGLTDEGLEDLAARLDITDILNRRLSSVSIGEQRRVDFARALVHSPKVLLIDEPVKGLDPHSALVIWRVLKEEREYGTTILMVTEDSSSAVRADRVGILVKGKVLATGTPTSLIADYCPSVLHLRLVDPGASRRELASVGMDMPDVGADGEVELQLDSASARDVIALLGDQVRHFEFHNGSLGEVVRVLSGQESTDDVRERHQPSHPDNVRILTPTGISTPTGHPDEVRISPPIHHPEDGRPFRSGHLAENPVMMTGNPARGDFSPDNVRVGDQPTHPDEVRISTPTGHPDDGRISSPMSYLDNDEEAEYFEEVDDRPDLEHEVEESVDNDWDDYVIAPVWADHPAADEPWDDDIYIRRDVHDQTTVPREMDNDLDPEEEDDESWNQPEPVQEHWHKARGFADTGRRAEYMIRPPTDSSDSESGDYPPESEIDDAVQRTDYFEEDEYAEKEYADEEFDDVLDDHRESDDDKDRPLVTFVPDQPEDFEDDQADLSRDYLAELNEVIWEEQQRASHADQLDRLAIVSRLLEDAVLTDPLPPFDEKFPIDQLPFVARDYGTQKPRRTTWYEEMRRPINEEMAKQARIKLAVEKRIEEARRRRDEQGGAA